MARVPFDPMKSAAMQTAKAQRRPPLSPDAPPLSPQEERALIESLAEDAADELITFPAGTPTKPLSVGAVNNLVNQVLAGALPQTFFIAGELSNFRTYDRGHAFFTLKEPGAELPCVLWKDALARLKFRPRDGMAVIAKGALKLYEPQGKLQLYVESLTPEGTGGLELAFRQLCDKLKAEGLFEAARKRPICRLPRCIVIITSRTGDVLHDVLTTAYRRFPALHVLLFPVRVQGEQAAPEIVRAIELINAHHAAALDEPHLDTDQSKIENQKSKIDLILLVRGGGSLEDLWAFNEELVARAICASRIPIATGIGHEPDTTIADLVGDLRGATPTAVTELTIPDVRNLLAEIDSRAALLTRDIRRLAESSRAQLDQHAHLLRSTMRESIAERTTTLDRLGRQIERIEPRHAIAQGWRRVEESQRNLAGAMRTRLYRQADTLSRLNARVAAASPANRTERLRDQLTHLESRLIGAQRLRLATASQKLVALATQLRVVSPQAVLDRGFSITTLPDGSIIRSVTQVKKGDLLKTRVADGTLDSTVGKPKQASLF